MNLTSSGWLCWIFLPKPKPTKDSAKMGLEAIKGANIPAKQNYLMIWCIVIWYHLKTQMPKELEALHLTSNYEDEDDYQKETMMIIRREGWLLWEKNGDDFERGKMMIMKREGWLLWEKNGDDYEKGRMIMRRGRLLLWEGGDYYEKGRMMIVRRGGEDLVRKYRLIISPPLTLKFGPRRWSRWLFSIWLIWEDIILQYNISMKYNEIRCISVTKFVYSQ